MNNIKDFDIQGDVLKDYTGCDPIVTIPPGVTTIQQFSGKGTKKVILSDEVKVISGESFSENEYLEEVVFSDSLEVIGIAAFCGCRKLKSVIIPKSVEYIGHLAFSSCPSLTHLEVAPENEVYYSWNNCIIEKVSGDLVVVCKNSIVPKEITKISAIIFSRIDAEKLEVSPENKTYHSDGNCIIETATGTLVCGCKTSVIPDYVIEIGEYAFYGCDGLTEINISDSVQTIRHNAFWVCKNLVKVVLGDGLKEVEEGAFDRCNKIQYNQVGDSYYLGSKTNPQKLLVMQKANGYCYCGLHGTRGMKKVYQLK